MERRGIPAVVLSSSAFQAKSLYDARTLGLPDARIAVFTHPLGGLRDDQVVERAAAMMDSLMSALAQQPKPREAVPAPGAALVAAPADSAALQAWTFERGWSDGLPVIAPTRAAVAQMVAGAGHDARDLVGIVPPRGGMASVEQIAVNAVMAGCRPEHMPVLIAALEAMLEERFNLAAIQATTHPVAPLLIVHGPIGRKDWQS